MAQLVIDVLLLQSLIAFLLICIKVNIFGSKEKYHDQLLGQASSSHYKVCHYQEQ